ncbi:hypothetical protein ACJDU8_22925 [Clostridium sp. WILCCON 0269]|uniref:Uncharacterized protein n=1 Tax=Candidatus Clostridium eludens TaxID=3381663 RepID=A0ABW8SQZ0_9CLOT
MGRKNIKGKNKELTDFSHLLNKYEKKKDNNRIEKDDKKED